MRTAVTRRVVVADLGTEPASCPSCRSLANLTRAALASTTLDISFTDRLPEALGEREPDVVIVRGPAHLPPEVLGSLRRAWRSVSILALVCDASEDAAEWLDSLDAGIDDFVFCPFSELELAARVRRLLPAAWKASRTEQELLEVKVRVDTLIGDSKPFQDALRRLVKVAASDATVLLTGETGVGKELFARAIHYGGARSGAPFIPVNCSAVPDHLFENELFGHAKGAYTDASSAAGGLLADAEGGTIFLDEIDALSPSAQAKLLRFLQDREYRPLGAGHPVRANVRIVAATNANLARSVSAREYRPDLFHRLNVLSLEIPPLRERSSDTLVLARHFLLRLEAQYLRGHLRLTPRAVRLLLSYPWPGNVRELESVLHRAVVFGGGDLLDAEDLELSEPSLDRLPPQHPKDAATDQFERGYLNGLLAEHRGNVSRAARAAGRDRRSVQRLLRKYGIDPSAFQDV